MILTINLSDVQVAKLLEAMPGVTKADVEKWLALQLRTEITKRLRIAAEEKTESALLIEKETLITALEEAGW